MAGYFLARMARSRTARPPPLMPPFTFSMRKRTAVVTFVARPPAIERPVAPLLVLACEPTRPVHPCLFRRG